MLSEKHNDPFYWKNKLETLQHLPGAIAAEKDAMWNKLHTRLQKKQATNKPVWYWIAATMLPLIIILLLVENKTEDRLVKNISDQENLKPVIPSFILPANKKSLTVSVSPPFVNKQTVSVFEEKNKSKKNDGTIRANQIVVVTKILPDTITTELTASKSIDTITAIAVAKNKLTVVHINELETVPAQFTAPVNYAQNLSEIKSKKNKNNNLTITTQPNSIGFKIKLSSKN